MEKGRKMAKWKVVLTDREFENIDQEISILKKVDAEVFAYQVKDENDLINIVKDADAVIMQYANLTSRVINSMEKCKIISKYAIGLDRIDIAAATKKNICVCNVPDYCIDEVSTYTIALLLGLNRKISFLCKTVKKGIWDYKLAKKIYSLAGAKIGLIGFGRIAKDVARKAQIFGLEVVAMDPFVEQEVADQYKVRMVDFDELIETSDIVSIHVPDIPSTKGMMNRNAFKRMKTTAYLLNMGRGPVINELDLIWALQNKEIAGAALDVTDPEPIAIDSPLLNMDNVIITPHAAYYTEESQAELQRRTAESVAQRLDGYYPKDLANKEIKRFVNLKEYV